MCLINPSKIKAAATTTTTTKKTKRQKKKIKNKKNKYFLSTYSVPGARNKNYNREA